MLASPCPTGIDAVPRPEAVRGELLELARRIRLTRSLLKLAEEVHDYTTPATQQPQPTKREVAHAS